MLDLILSILCGTAIFLIFRLFQNHKVPPFPTIVINYWVCIGVGVLVDPGILQLSVIETSTGWLYMSAFLGVLFIGGFYLTHLTVANTGITAASIASKNAMVISISAAFFLYQDAVNPLKIVGIILAILAIVLASIRKKEEPALLGKVLFYPILLFLISGTIETALKYSQQRLMDAAFHTHFTTYLFGTAAVLGALLLGAQGIINRPRLAGHNWGKILTGGILLGIPNFGSIYFLIRALDQPGWESSLVYPVINVAIVFMSAVSARLFFKERLSRVNILGIALAILALTCLLGSTLLYNGT